MLDAVNKGRLTLERCSDLTSVGPARVFGIAGKGRIAAGYDSDFTIVDLKVRRRIENRAIASRCGWTPYDGMEMTGWPVATIVRGCVVMRDGETLGSPRGQMLRFAETLAPIAA
jgi:dihydroorotase